MIMSFNYAKIKEIRHNWIIDLRSMNKRGKTMPELKDYCIHNLKGSTITANSYIDEAAEPYRKQYQKEQDEK